MSVQPPPAKLARTLELAERRGLVVTEHPDPDGLRALLVRAWRISPDPGKRYVSHVLFVYWTDGARGGRRSWYLYTPHTGKSRKITGRDAGAWLSVLST